MENKVTLNVQGRKLQLGHVEKVLFPKAGFTKAHVIDYYVRASDILLPHLRQRPLTLKLYLNGVGSPVRYIKNAPAYTPQWVPTTPVERKGGGEAIRFVLVNDLATLVWVAHLNNIEMHTFLAKAPHVDTPTMVVFDLDPGPPATMVDAAAAALWLREELQRAGLASWAKTSGSKGVHVHVPLNRAVTYTQTSEFAREIATRLQTARPESILLQMAKAARVGKVFIDYTQNVAFKSTVCAYSLRAREEGPSVAMPVTWEELERAVDRRDLGLLHFTPEEALSRVSQLGDLLKPVLSMKQKLPSRLPDHSEKALPKLKRSSQRGSKGIPEYNRKRKFGITPEPAGKRGKALEGRSLRFVIQKHAASHLHYDFRLEMEGVLRSWAVPKGPPYKRGEKRLAMHVEDHPLDYAGFEGIIPAGQYGGGTVMVWDQGTYSMRDGENPVAAYHQGKLHLVIHGKKLKGAWTLVKIKTDEKGRESWFLIKSGEDATAVSARSDDRSAVSGRSMEQIAKQKTAEWQSHR